MSKSDVSALISKFRAINEKYAVTPESVGYLLQLVLDNSDLSEESKELLSRCSNLLVFYGSLDESVSPTFDSVGTASGNVVFCPKLSRFIVADSRGKYYAVWPDVALWGEYDTSGAIPAENHLYLDAVTGSFYRWSGNALVKIGVSLSDIEQSLTESSDRIPSSKAVKAAISSAVQGMEKVYRIEVNVVSGKLAVTSSQSVIDEAYNNLRYNGRPVSGICMLNYSYRNFMAVEINANNGSTVKAYFRVDEDNLSTLVPTKGYILVTLSSTSGQSTAEFVADTDIPSEIKNAVDDFHISVPCATTDYMNFTLSLDDTSAKELLEKIDANPSQETIKLSLGGRHQFQCSGMQYTYPGHKVYRLWFSVPEGMFDMMPGTIEVGLSETASERYITYIPDKFVINAAASDDWSNIGIKDLDSGRVRQIERLLKRGGDSVSGLGILLNVNDSNAIQCAGVEYRQQGSDTWHLMFPVPESDMGKARGTIKVVISPYYGMGYDVQFIPSGLAVKEDVGEIAFRPLWDTACGEYGGYKPDEAPDKSKPYYLNELWLTYDEAKLIMKYGNAPSAYMGNYYRNAGIKTNLPILGSGSAQTYDCTFLSCARIEVALVSLAKLTVYTFSSCRALRRIGTTTGQMQIYDLNTGATNGTFENCSNLEMVYGSIRGSLINVQDCGKLTIENFQWWLEHAYNTSAVTVTVHADVYAALTGEAESYPFNNGTKEQWEKVLSDAAEKNISFASA